MQGTIYEMALDVSGHAHRTGAVLNPGPNATLDELYVWRYKNRHFVSPFAGEDESEGVEELMPEEVLAAVGDPTTRAFPLNEGIWSIWNADSDHPSRGLVHGGANSAQSA